MVIKTRTSSQVFVLLHVLFYIHQIHQCLLQLRVRVLEDNLLFEEFHHGGPDEGDFFVPEFAAVQNNLRMSSQESSERDNRLRVLFSPLEDSLACQYKIGRPCVDIVPKFLEPLQSQREVSIC